MAPAALEWEQDKVAVGKSHVDGQEPGNNEFQVSFGDTTRRSRNDVPQYGDIYVGVGVGLEIGQQTVRPASVFTLIAEEPVRRSAPACKRQVSTNKSTVFFEHRQL